VRRGGFWPDAQSLAINLKLEQDSGATSDGKDLGADVDGVENATTNSPTGNWPAP
jgi:hypothetical protein